MQESDIAKSVVGKNSHFIPRKKILHAKDVISCVIPPPKQTIFEDLSASKLEKKLTNFNTVSIFLFFSSASIKNMFSLFIKEKIFLYKSYTFESMTKKVLFRS